MANSFILKHHKITATWTQKKPWKSIPAVVENIPTKVATYKIQNLPQMWRNLLANIQKLDEKLKEFSVFYLNFTLLYKYRISGASSHLQNVCRKQSFFPRQSFFSRAFNFGYLPCFIYMNTLSEYSMSSSSDSPFKHFLRLMPIRIYDS